MNPDVISVNQIFYSVAENYLIVTGQLPLLRGAREVAIYEIQNRMLNTPFKIATVLLAAAIANVIFAKFATFFLLVVGVYWLYTKVRREGFVLENRAENSFNAQGIFARIRNAFSPSRP